MVFSCDELFICIVFVNFGFFWHFRVIFVRLPFKNGRASITAVECVESSSFVFLPDRPIQENGQVAQANAVVSKASQNGFKFIVKCV